MAEFAVPPEIVEAIGRLKEVPRTGWLDRGIPAEDTESVADHSFGVALLAWLLAPDGLDRGRVVELALLHDLAESVVGDITPYDREAMRELDSEARREALNRRHARSNDASRAKQAAEDAAIAELAATLPDKSSARLEKHWAELRERSTPEARFVKEMDVLETYLQSRRYLGRYPDAPMESFRLEIQDSAGS